MTKLTKNACIDVCYFLFSIFSSFYQNPKNHWNLNIGVGVTLEDVFLPIASIPKLKKLDL